MSRDFSFSQAVVALIRSIPPGKVATYGQIAACAGNPGAARGVVWILHAASRKHGLPWHRVVNSRGTISLRPGGGYEEQRSRLEAEGLRFDERGRLDLQRCLWPLVAPRAEDAPGAAPSAGAPAEKG
jgi:methylated-DNA-protein-cysteine methyltransferase-like protein